MSATSDRHNSPATAVGAAARRSPLAAAVRRVLREPRFVVAALVLAVSAAGLNAATQFLRLHFRKLPVSLRVPSLQDDAAGIPAELDGAAAGVPSAGRWVQVSRDELMNPDVEQALGTKQHLTRDYF